MMYYFHYIIHLQQGSAITLVGCSWCSNAVSWKSALAWRANVRAATNFPLQLYLRQLQAT